MQNKAYLLFMQKHTSNHPLIFPFTQGGRGCWKLYQLCLDKVQVHPGQVSGLSLRNVRMMPIRWSFEDTLVVTLNFLL